MQQFGNYLHYYSVFERVFINHMMFQLGPLGAHRRASALPALEIPLPATRVVNSRVDLNTMTLIKSTSTLFLPSLAKHISVNLQH